MKNQKNSARRTFLKQSGAAMVFVPTAVFASKVMAAEMLDPASDKAVGLGYVAKTEVEGQLCSNCALYQNGDDTAGDCPLFQGVKVGAEAWCNAWAAKG